jgi:hypothetical protein
MAIPRLNPKLMAIGDSLPQGCRHLSVKASFCAQSWPRRIAQAQGWDFVVPDHPQEVLFDLEREVRLLNPAFLSPANLAFLGLPGRILENFRAWQKQPGGSRFECFDNVAVAGARVSDLYSLTSGNCDLIIKELTPRGEVDVLQHIERLHLPINARFVLNPQQKAEYMGFTPLDWVEKRQPEILLVQCGHNHGLFGFGFEAKDQSSITQGDHNGLDYWAQWRKVGDRLGALPPAVKTILVVLLPKVGAVSALHPVSEQRIKGYAPLYEPRVLPIARTLTGTRVAEVDEMIRDANKKIETIIREAAKGKGTEARLTFVDGYAALDALDYKNTLDSKRRLRLPGNLSVDNRYLDGKPNFPELFKGTLVAGGYQSIDGMHLSGVGYADIASRAMQALKLPHTAAERNQLLHRGWVEDPMLSNYPLEHDGLIRLIDIARSLTHANHFIPPDATILADDTHLAVSLPMLAATFT